QGVIAYVSPIDYADLETVVSIALFQKKVPLVLVLDRLTDVRNLGAIARTAECAGVTAIVIPNKESAPINADAMKTSAGALNYIPVCRVDNLIDAILLLQQSGLQVFAASEKATKSIYETDFTVPMALIMGNEEEGVSPQLLRRANELLTIPMVGKIDSLNVSVAAGVMVYEVIRQRMGV
ncbi:MAG: 23S rRNA (guanosine(2251)-2'-O)-methyltransferase RlmB, partial [Flexibacteraceae bacterium]